MLILALYKVSIKRQPRAPDQSSRIPFSDNTNVPRDYDFPALVKSTVCSFERDKISFSVTCVTDVSSLSFFFGGFNGNLKGSPVKDTFKTPELKLVTGAIPGFLATVISLVTIVKLVKECGTTNRR